jgi:hypothetical protein
MAHERKRVSMMSLLLGRLLLLFLLACDWAGDPYFGHSPLSTVMASQEVVCESLTYQASLVQQVDQHHTPVFQSCAEGIEAVHCGIGPASFLANRLPSSRRTRLYLFGSILL